MKPQNLGMSMSLLDNVFSSVTSAFGGEKASAINSFIESNGGVAGLSQTFQSGGLGPLFSSWVSTGDNATVTAHQIEAVMGNARVQALAKQMGVDPAVASDFIAKALPQVVDKLTPHGQVSGQVS
jgi:uncharacterized protein YidB (DUF937 family)